MIRLDSTTPVAGRTFLYGNGLRLTMIERIHPSYSYLFQYILINEINDAFHFLSKEEWDNIKDSDKVEDIMYERIKQIYTKKSGYKHPICDASYPYMYNNYNFNTTICSKYISYYSYLFDNIDSIRINFDYNNISFSNFLFYLLSYSVITYEYNLYRNDINNVEFTVNETSEDLKNLLSSVVITAKQFILSKYYRIKIRQDGSIYGISPGLNNQYIDFPSSCNPIIEELVKRIYKCKCQLLVFNDDNCCIIPEPQTTALSALNLSIIKAIVSCYAKVTPFMYFHKEFPLYYDLIFNNNLKILLLNSKQQRISPLPEYLISQPIYLQLSKTLSYYNDLFGPISNNNTDTHTGTASISQISTTPNQSQAMTKSKLFKEKTEYYSFELKIDDTHRIIQLCVVGKSVANDEYKLSVGYSIIVNEFDINSTVLEVAKKIAYNRATSNKNVYLLEETVSYPEFFFRYFSLKLFAESVASKIKRGVIKLKEIEYFNNKNKKAVENESNR